MTRPTPHHLLTERYAGCQIQEAVRFIQDFQDGRGPDDLLAAFLKILNKRFSRYPENILKNVQPPDSTTQHQRRKWLRRFIFQPRLGHVPSLREGALLAIDTP